MGFLRQFKRKHWLVCTFLLMSTAAALFQQCGKLDDLFELPEAVTVPSPDNEEENNGEQDGGGVPVVAEPLIPNTFLLRNDLALEVDAAMDPRILGGDCSFASGPESYGYAEQDCVEDWFWGSFKINSPWKAPGYLAGQSQEGVLSLCGKQDLLCSGDGSSRATRLRLATSLAHFELINGSDSVDQCSDCGGSFTLAAVVRKDFARFKQAQYLLIDKDGYAHKVGPVLGFPNDGQLVFGTNGKSGNNQVSLSVAESGVSDQLDLVIARFSRESGLLLNWNGCVAHDITKTQGADNSSSKMPAMGLGSASSGARLDIHALLSFHKSLSDAELCELAEDLNEEFNLGLSDPCGQRQDACLN